MTTEENIKRIYEYKNIENVDLGTVFFSISRGFPACVTNKWEFSFRFYLTQPYLPTCSRGLRGRVVRVLGSQSLRRSQRWFD